MSTAAVATLAVTQLEVTVFDLDAAVARARIEFERNRAAVGLAYYSWQAKRLFRRVEFELEAVMPSLNDAQMKQVSALLRAPLDPMRPTLARVQVQRPSLSSFERYVIDGFIQTVAEIDRLADRVVQQAERTPRKMVYPLLDARQRADAMMASVFLPAVRRDPSEDDPDPDYGF